MTFPNVSFFLCDHLVFTILQHNFYLFVYQGHRASRSTPSTIFSKILWKIWCHMSNSPDPSDTEVTLSEKSDSSQYLNCLWAAWQLVVEHHLVSAVGCCSLVNVFLHLLYLHCNPRHVFLIISLKEPSHYLSLPMLIYPIHKCKNKFSFFFFFFHGCIFSRCFFCIWNNLFALQSCQTPPGSLICSRKDSLLFLTTLQADPETSFCILLTVLYLTYQRFKALSFTPF